MEHQTTSLFQRFLSFARDRPDIAIALAALMVIAYIIHRASIDPATGFTALGIAAIAAVVFIFTKLFDSF